MRFMVGVEELISSLPCTSPFVRYGSYASVLRAFLRSGGPGCSDYLAQLVTMLCSALCCPSEEVASGAAECVGAIATECDAQLAAYPAIVKGLCDAYEVRVEAIS